MRRLAILLCFCACAFMVNAQKDVTLKHLENVDSKISIIPFSYANKKFQNFDLNISFSYNQLEDVITATIESPKRSVYDFNYDLLWIPKKEFSLLSQKQFKKSFFTEYNQKISLDKLFKKQLRKTGWDKISPILCEGCSVLSCKYGSDSKKYMNPYLANEMFYLDENSIIIKISVPPESRTPKMTLAGLLVASTDRNSFTSSKKILLNYMADDIIFWFTIIKDPCIEDKNAIEEVNDEIIKLQNNFKAMDNAKKKNDEGECIKIQDKVRSEAKTRNLKKMYGRSNCDKLQTALKEYQENLQIITSCICATNPCKHPKMLQMIDTVENSIMSLNLIFDDANIAVAKNNEAELKRLKSLSQDLKSKCDNKMQAIKDMKPCDTLTLLRKKQQEIVEKTLALYILPPDCNLNPSEIYKAGKDIKKLTDEWVLGNHKTKSIFDQIRSTIDKKIKSATASCRSKCNESIIYYNSFVDAYIEIAK